MKKKSKNSLKYQPGTKLSYLTILKVTVEKPFKKVLCRCICGKEKEYYLSNIIPKPNARYTYSCGCKRSHMVSEKNKKHGMCGTKFYKRWRSMFDRCLPSYICSDSYVGISVDERWNDFKLFYEDMYESYISHRKVHGERKTTLDRIDVFGNYNKDNCRWATPKQQENNKKRHRTN